jgi:hypothetical protein
MPFVFSHLEFCDMHFVYGFWNGKSLAATEEYQRRFPDRMIPSRSVFTRIHQTLCDTGFLSSVSVQFETEVVRTINSSAWGHLIPSSYCDVGRFCCRLYKF